jgi:HSP20 family molecular chaperone IbpA
MRYSDPRAKMWAEACEMLDQVERLQRQFFRPSGAPARPAWEPPVDVFETDDTLRIVTALPGVAAEDVRIVAENGALTVTGERRVARESAGTILRLEIPYGHFERRLALPPGRYELLDHHLRDGCLTLQLRKLG